MIGPMMMGLFSGVMKNAMGGGRDQQPQGPPQPPQPNQMPPRPQFMQPAPQIAPNQLQDHQGMWRTMMANALRRYQQ